MFAGDYNPSCVTLVPIRKDCSQLTHYGHVGGRREDGHSRTRKWLSPDPTSHNALNCDFPNGFLLLVSHFVLGSMLNILKLGGNKKMIIT